MEITKGKISIRQAYIILLLALTAPTLRVVPNYIAQLAEEASWVTPFVALIPGILLIYVVNVLFQKYRDKSLYEVYVGVFGKIITKLIFVIYGVWLIVLCSLYLRMFGERFIGTLLFNADLNILLAIMILFVAIAGMKKFETLGRLSELLLIFIVVLFVAVTFAILPKIRLENLYPVTYYDTLPVLKSVIPVFSLFTYTTPLLLLGDKISHKDQLKKYGKRTLFIMMTFFVFLILSTVGLFGYSVNQQFIFPYYIVLNSVSLFGNVERLEALFISTWLASDFAIVLLFVFMITQTSKKLFHARKETWFVIPVCVIVYVLALMLFKSIHQVQFFARNILVYVNISLFAVLPLVALVVGKVRKKV